MDYLQNLLPEWMIYPGRYAHLYSQLLCLIPLIPFAGFLVLFMYLAGLIPAQPIVVEIPSDAVVRQLGEDPAEDAAQPEKATRQETVEAPTTAVSGQPAQEPAQTPEDEPAAEPLKETVEQVSPSVAEKPLIVKDPMDEERANRVKQIAKVYDQMHPRAKKKKTMNTGRPVRRQNSLLLSFTSRRCCTICDYFKGLQGGL